MVKAAFGINTDLTLWKFLIRALLVLIIVGVQGSCAYAPRNEPLKKWDPATGYRVLHSHLRGDKETIFTMGFSGGGTRSAAFAYGVLEELADTKVDIDDQPHRLIDEIDMLAGVSGGSFTAAYYALFGDRIFEDFESRFLKYDIEGDLIWKILAPWNLFHLMSPDYSRSDLAIEFYDEQLFEGATFGMLEAGDGPRLRINATDLSTGNPFPFDQNVFDFICSDLSKFPVARAVGSSTALPIVFPPVTLKNYAGTCGFERPAWLDQALNEAQMSDSRQWRYARVMVSYLEQENRPYVHLIDGGISDNLAAIRLATGFQSWMTQEEAKNKDIKRVVVLVVNSQTESKLTWALVDQDPSVTALLASMTNAQIDVLSSETLAYYKNLFTLFQEQTSARGLPIKFYFIQVSFNMAEDEAEREYLNNLPTTLSLPDKDVDHLRRAARELLRKNPEYQRLLRDISKRH